MLRFRVLVAVSAVAALVGATSAGATRPLKAPAITLASYSIEPDQTVQGTFDVTATVTWNRIPNVSLWEPCSAVGFEKPQCDFLSQKTLTSYTFHVSSLSSGDTATFSVFACYVTGASSYACTGSNTASVTVP
jgi:hypothetical protein